MDIVPDGEFAVKVYFVHDTFYQCGFTFAVLTDECDFFAPVDGEVHVMENDVFTIGFAHIFADNRIVSATAGGREFQAQRGVVFIVHFDAVYLFQLLDTALYLYGFGGFVAEAFDEVFRILYLFLLVLVGTDLLFAAFLAQDYKFIVFHFVVINLAAGDFDGSGSYVVQEGTVVAD